MNKEMYLASLKQHLAGLPPTESVDIIRDQEEYFRDAMAAGRSESEIIKSLGDPKAFALSLFAESKINSAEGSTTIKQQVGRTMGAVVAILALAPLNLFFVAGPFIALLGITFAGWAMACSTLLIGAVILFSFLSKVLIVGAGAWSALSGLFLSLGSIGLGLLAIAFMCLATNLILKGTVAYLKWNLNFIKSRA